MVQYYRGNHLKLIEVSLVTAGVTNDDDCMDFISWKAIKTSLALTVCWFVAWTFKIESCLHVNRSRYDGQPAMHYACKIVSVVRY